MLALLGLLPAASGSAGDVAVIVHPSNPEADIRSSDLVEIFRMEQRYWKAGERIYLVLQESGTAEKDLVLKRIYGMKDAEMKRYWLGKLFRGEIAAFPRVAHSNADARRIVGQAPNAIGFVDVAGVDSSVKVMRIDGKKPGDAGYLLAPP